MFRVIAGASGVGLGLLAAITPWTGNAGGGWTAPGSNEPVLVWSFWLTVGAMALAAICSVVRQGVAALIMVGLAVVAFIVAIISTQTPAGGGWGVALWLLIGGLLLQVVAALVALRRKPVETTVPGQPVGQRGPARPQFLRRRRQTSDDLAAGRSHPEREGKHLKGH